MVRHLLNPNNYLPPNIHISLTAQAEQASKAVPDTLMGPKAKPLPSMTTDVNRCYWSACNELGNL